MNCFSNPHATKIADPAGKCIQLPGDLQLNGVSQDFSPGATVWPIPDGLRRYYESMKTCLGVIVKRPFVTC